ncbi:MAG: mechanosensitive ion channel family protein [Deltaproteobacteria bacterium]|nr:MAG: mechanosensitive ion channel family protein [Deltaproteobacteria bacterium]
MDNLQEGSYRPQRAITCFDWDGAGIPRGERVERAEHLLEALDILGMLVPVDAISDSADGDGDHRVPLFSQAMPELFFVQTEDGWVFSASSIQFISELHGDVVSVDVETYVRSLPAWLRATPLFGIAWWQIFGALIAIMVSILLRQLVSWSVSSYGAKLVERAGLKASAELVGRASQPIGTIAMAGLLYWALPLMRFGVQTNRVAHIGIRVLAAVSAVFVLYRIVDVVADLFARKAATTDTKLDDQLVPLVRRTAKVMVVGVGVIFVLQNMDVDVTSLLAMGTVGTLAVSFAAKDMVSNFFGSVSIFTDRPFHVGDWVVIGSVEGVVEEVGMRSTRVRTFYNSLITLPNSTITVTAVDNYGVRQYRRCSIVLNLTYDTTPEQMQAFCDGVRAVLKANPTVRKDMYEVHFTAFGAASLDVMVYFFFEVASWSEELRERHNVYLEFLRLAKELGVEFAFPTQTLHVESMAAPSSAEAPVVPSEEQLEAKVLAFSPGGKLSRPAGPRITHGFFAGQTPKGSDAADAGEG